MTQPVRIAVLHYHLQRGGVTSVIEHACNALPRDRFRTAVIVGQPPSKPGPLPCEVVPELDYGGYPDDIDDLVDELGTVAARALGGPPDIWHIHNHSLGKNISMPLLASALSEKGERLLLQPHDFAEDGRALNYVWMRESIDRSDFKKLYPFSARIRYALLNGRDRRILQAAGVPAEFLKPLPNPVPHFWLETESIAPPKDLTEGELLLYPTRAIRRKNLGELLFWAALADQGRSFGVTLAPENPYEQPLYRRWQALANTLGLPIKFELGLAHSIRSLFAASRCAISTSLAEGFGLAFLEPWMAGRALVGRRLPEITADFEKWNIDLAHCYDRLDVPVEWVGETVLRSELWNSRKSILSKYELEATAADRERLLAAAIMDGKVDFGSLGEKLQAKVIHQLAESAQARSEIDPQLPLAEATSKIDGNRRRIARELDLDHYAARLGRIYAELMEAPSEAPQYCDLDKLLTEFLAPERFRMLLAQ